MNCEELRGHFELFAMGVAEEPERSEIREHLDRGCEVCMGEMKRARQLAALLGGAAPPAAPSPRLRRRILAAAGYEERRFGLAPFLAAAALLFLSAAFYFATRENSLVAETVQLRQKLRDATIRLTELNEAFAILNGADTTVASFGQGNPRPPQGKAFLTSRGVLLIVSNLPPAPGGKAYEMWVIPKGAKAVPAGMFQSDADGSAVHVQPGPLDPHTTAAVAVTLENQAGAPQPTSQPLIAAPVSVP